MHTLPDVDDEKNVVDNIQIDEQEWLVSERRVVTIEQHQNASDVSNTSKAKRKKILFLLTDSIAFSKR